MAHQVIRSGYDSLVDRINRFPQGAPPSPLLYKILHILFSEQDAALVAKLPIKPFHTDQAAKIWDMPPAQAQNILDQLSGRALLVDIEEPDGRSVYVLPPPMAGFFEFSMMRTRGDIDQHLLAQLFYEYCNEEEDFIKNLFVQGETQLGRVFVHEPVLSKENDAHVLDYERASEVIRSSPKMGISTCYCRSKMQHMGRACDAPLDICMTFNASAGSLIKHGFARSVDVKEGLDLLDQAYEHNLVQFGENCRQGVNFICNCCGCCCEAMLAAKRFGLLHPLHTTNFMPEIDYEKCITCGICVERCPVEAMGLVSANDSKHPKKKKPLINTELCLGCGICARNCPEKAIRMESRKERIITPLNSTHRCVVMAIERGKFQNLLFDNQVLWSHRALAAVLGVVLKLPGIKQIMALKQVKSRYLEFMIQKFYHG
ncbi:MAG: 4Fe-4S binding protein [Desulfoplanes sp.]|nr:4Fe-4S binding protein [Desulfoplanes sp.]